MPDNYSLSLYSARATNSVTLEQAKLHLKQDESADDDLISSLITAAEDWCEQFTGRRFVTQTWDLKLNCFPDYIRVPYPPLISATITYIDTAGDTQTLSTDYYAVDSAREPGRITLKYGQAWPATRSIENAVTVRYVAGVAAASVPAQVKAAIKLLVGSLYENRESVVIGTTAAQVPQTVEHLLWPIRVVEIP